MIYRIFAIVLLFCSFSAHALTYSASQSFTTSWGPVPAGMIPCEHILQASGAVGWTSVGVDANSCLFTKPGFSPWGPHPVTTIYSCPSGGALSGNAVSGYICTKPDCVAPQTYNPTSNQCETTVAPCPTGQYSSGYYKGVASPGCAPNGCMVAFSGTYPAGKDATGQLYSQGSYDYAGGGNQGQCTPGGVAASATTTPSTTAPPCSPSEGVMASSSGTVACVPSGTPNSEPPKVSSTTETITAADGSTKVTTTTNTCTGAGSCSSTTTTTTTGVGGASGAGATPGQSGTPGTETAKKDEAGQDFCAKNGNLQICKGGISEESTQKKVQEASEKIRDSLDSKGFDPASHLTIGDASEAEKNAVLQKYNIVIQEAQKFGGVADPAYAKYQEFRDAMGSWWEPINISGCSPFSSKIGLWTWAFDICPTAAKISEIGSYCMWVLLAFGMFAATTKEAK